MQSIASYKRHLPALLLMTLLALVGLSVLMLQSGALQSKEAKLAVKGQSKVAINVTSRQDADDNRLELMVPKPVGTKVQGLKEAVSKISVRPKLPNPAVAGNPKEIYVLDAPTFEQRGIEIFYENGMHIQIHPNVPAPDYAALKKQVPDFEDIDINGIKGLADEPEKKVLPISGEVLESGVITWYEKGTEYTIYGDDAGRVRLNTMLSVAKSMRLPAKP